MQALGARTTRVRTASRQAFQKSFSRLSSTGLLTRRSTTAPVQRRLGCNDVCTVLFSTVVFASAVADSNRKSARRGEWINRIEEARNDLSVLKADQERRVSSLAHSIRGSTELHDAEHGEKGSPTWQELFTWAEGEMREREVLGYGDWQGIPLDVLREASSDQIQDFQDNYRHCFARFRGNPGVEVWNTATWPLHIKKIRTLEWSIAYMTLQLMSHTPTFQQHDLSHDPEISDEVMSRLFISSPRERCSRLDYIRDKLHILQQDKKSDDFYCQFESPEFPRYNSDQVDNSRTADQLNANLHALFEFAPQDSSRIGRILPKICYYLLTSTAPPDIHTYNLLISECAGQNQQTLVRHLLASINRTHMRPNEVTLAETLRYYARTRQCRLFDLFVDRMNGFGEGFGEASPQLDIPDLVKFQYRIRITQKDANQEQINKYYDCTSFEKSDIHNMRREATVKVYEKPRRNLDVYQALIQGALLFHGMPEAKKHYQTMISEGWEPNEEILLSILHRSVVDTDWDTGNATWTRLHGCGVHADEHAYLLMLQLCRKLGKDQVIQELLRNGIARGVLPPTVYEMGLLECTEHEGIEGAEKALKMAKDAWTLEKGLEDLLQERQVVDGEVQKKLERLEVITDDIKSLVRYPSAKTVTMLREARVYTSVNRKYSKLIIALRDYSVQIEMMVNQFNDIQLLTKVRGFEIDVEAEFVAIAQIMDDAMSALLSTCSQNLADCFNKLSAIMVRLNDNYDRQMLSINVRSLKARYCAIEADTFPMRMRASSLFPSLIGPLLLDLQSRLNRLQSQVSLQLKKMLTATVSRWAITSDELDKPGKQAFNIQQRPFVRTDLQPTLERPTCETGNLTFRRCAKWNTKAENSRKINLAGAAQLSSKIQDYPTSEEFDKPGKDSRCQVRPEVDDHAKRSESKRLHGKQHKAINIHKQPFVRLNLQPALERSTNESSKFAIRRVNSRKVYGTAAARFPSIIPDYPTPKIKETLGVASEYQVDAFKGSVVASGGRTAFRICNAWDKPSLNLDMVQENFRCSATVNVGDGMSCRLDQSWLTPSITSLSSAKLVTDYEINGSITATGVV